MDDNARIVLAAVIGTVLVLIMIAFVVMLLVVNSNRRNRHRAELAELRLERDREVMRAEREATRQTLREVGRELHDNVGQLLTVVQMGINAVLEGEARDTRLDVARDTLEQSIAEVRRLGHDLNSDMWQDRSLTDAISAEAERIERVGRSRCLVVMKGTPRPIPADTSTILFRVFQEIVNNALKHSGADTITITLDATGPLMITIADNGKGFDPGRVKTNGGIVNIDRRCALVGYSAKCITNPSNGCTWVIGPLVEA